MWKRVYGLELPSDLFLKERRGRIYFAARHRPRVGLEAATVR